MSEKLIQTNRELCVCVREREREYVQSRETEKRNVFEVLERGRVMRIRE